MKREEQIRQKAISEQRSLMESCDWRAGFIAGAKWADKTMIEKACEWLFKNTYKGVDDSRVYTTFTYTVDMIEDFRKAMEE